MDNTGATVKPYCVLPEHDDMREFLLVLRQALLMVVRFIEKRYGLKSE